MAEQPKSRTNIGFVVGGGLKENLRARLTVGSNEVQEGSFVVIDHAGWRYFGLVTDIRLSAADPRFADEQSEQRLPKDLAALLRGQTLFTDLEVYPALMMELGPDPAVDPQAAADWQPNKAGAIAVKTIPAHHAEVMLATEQDIAAVYGGEDSEAMFAIGKTREQGHRVNIDLDRFIQRSSGIFGATGTGKSFLTLVVLAGLMKRDKASLLIFDMHNEYAYDVQDANKGTTIPGLKQKFGGSKVQIVGLGQGASAIYRGNAPDINLEISKDDIQIEDIELLWSELNLRDTTPTTLSALVRSFGDKWFSRFLALESSPKLEGAEGKEYPEDSLEGWAQRNNVHPKAAEALQGRLRKIADLDYVVDGSSHKVIDQIIDNLKNGRHIILSFGKHGSPLDFLLVSNLLTRKIRAEWERMMTQSFTEQTKEPRPLVIVVEEAHKLLNKETAVQTTFSTIARELRKYNVTLIIVDQRPSQIYDEVMSQLGTRISGWLGDDDDIRAVLSGLAGRDTLKGMLSRLQSGEDVLLLGPWGVPMPLPVRSRRFNMEFWEELNPGGGKKTAKDISEELGY